MAAHSQSPKRKLPGIPINPNYGRPWPTATSTSLASKGNWAGCPRLWPPIAAPVNLLNPILNHGADEAADNRTSVFRHQEPDDTLAVLHHSSALMDECLGDDTSRLWCQVELARILYWTAVTEDHLDHAADAVRNFQRSGAIRRPRSSRRSGGIKSGHPGDVLPLHRPSGCRQRAAERCPRTLSKSDRDPQGLAQVRPSEYHPSRRLRRLLASARRGDGGSRPA